MNTQTHNLTQWVQTTTTNVGDTRVTLTHYVGEGVYAVRTYLPFSDWPTYSAVVVNADDAWDLFRGRQAQAIAAD